MASKQSPPALDSRRKSSSPTPLPPPPAAASTGLRHRPLSRAATFAETRPLKERRSSVFSDLSDTRKAFKESTDDIFLPRAKQIPDSVSADHETSNWQSIPLGLALLPAVAGILFEGGSAVVTDITLLSLAAVFLNWSVRIPWDLYHSAQSIKKPDHPYPPMFDPILEEDEKEDSDDPALASSQELPVPEDRKQSHEKQIKPNSPAAEAAQKELQAHELLAFLSCFVAPIAAAWLLHAIRSQLSRPSEGLVSNYNLTVFLLAAEIRPLRHLLKMIASRTLHLQKFVNPESMSESSKPSSDELIDLAHRIEELETHIANSAIQAEKAASANIATATTDESKSTPSSPMATADLTTTTDAMQSDLSALNRAVRRYEKRLALLSLQSDTRIQDLESKLQDAIVLAAAAQRSVEKQQSPLYFIAILINWAAAAIVLPLRLTWTIVTMPIGWAEKILKTIIGEKGSSTKGNGRSGMYSSGISKPRDREGRMKYKLGGGRGSGGSGLGTGRIFGMGSPSRNANGSGNGNGSTGHQTQAQNQAMRMRTGEKSSRL